MNEADYGKMISEIREWLVRIDTNQQHQTKLLEGLTEQSSNAFSKADNAEDLANAAIKKAEEVGAELDDYKKEQAEQRKEQAVGRRWAIGTVITAVVFLLPMIISFYAP